MSEIVLENVSKRWGDTVAVDRLTTRADAGKFLVLLGPSGCGKSTTLRMIAGLEDMTSGRVLIEGRGVTRLPPAQRRISMVFQSYALFPHLSVAENIVFGLRVRRTAAGERNERLARVASLAGLGEQLGRKPAQLSGGQRQRVALARAIIAENPICLMDEPLSNLDAKLRHEMRVEIRDLQSRLGMTVVYVTHDQDEAMSLADKVILMRDGRIEQEAAPAELYERPDTIFAARCGA
ncbi:MAG TPA: ABC transporter ATP-binding protein [Paracoccaceae bacterium]|nr:ABC transporter ATP-binding protein [Paracoccaceae bacterium]